MSKGPIFLAASIPERDLDIYVPDPIGIREAIRALVAETVRERLLVFGGHPAISPLIEHAATCLDAVDNVRIYQSRYFKRVIPKVAKRFKHLVWTPAVRRDRNASLTRMRTEMITSERFASAVFIGGMDGLNEEWGLFKTHQPHAPAYPIASTEGAARLLWNLWTPSASVNLPAEVRDRLGQDLDYRLLFRDLLG
jgi:hypothetical protein